MDHLIDTNVAPRWSVPNDPLNPVAVSAVDTLRARGDRSCIAAQNLVEFRAFSTRPAGPPSNGLGLSPAAADAELARMKSFYIYLPDIPANSVKVTWFGGLAVATDLGVLYRAPGHTTWAVLGRNLPTTTTLQLKIGPTGLRLYAATHGRGIWSFNLPDLYYR